MATGPRSTYTDTGPNKRSVNDLISMIDPSEAALLDLFGIDNVKKFKLQNWPSTKYEWLEDTLSLRAGTLNEALTDSETDMDVQTGEGALMKAGDIVKVGTELIYIVSVATDTATVTRGFAGSIAAAHDDDSPWKIVTIARKEGASASTGHTTALSIPYNYTQIISEAVKVTGSAQVNSQYGINDQMAHHITRLIGGGGGMGGRNKAGKLALALQGIFYHGSRYIGTDDISRAAGGFEYFVTSNVEDLSSAALTREYVENLQQDCFDAGGDPDTVIVNSRLRRKLTTLYKENIETTIDEERGGHRITHIDTDLGKLRIVLDRFCPTDRLYMCEKDKIGWLPYRPFDIHDRASDGDFKLKEVLGEFGFVVMNEKAHGYLKNVSTTK